MLNISRTSLIISFIIFSWMTMWTVSILLVEEKLPKPLDINVPLNTFSEARTRNYLEQLLAFGHRPLNTQANKNARNLILNHFSQLITNSQNNNPNYNNGPILEILASGQDENFTVVSWETLNSWSTFESTNILVRIGKEPIANATKKQTMMFNSHYDTVYGTEGASDDGVNVAIMMELANNLMNRGPLDIDVYFLFNNGEEIWKVFEISPSYCCVGARAFLKTNPYPFPFSVYSLSFLCLSVFFFSFFLSFSLLSFFSFFLLFLFKKQKTKKQKTKVGMKV